MTKQAISRFMSLVEARKNSVSKKDIDSLVEGAKREYKKWKRSDEGSEEALQSAVDLASILCEICFREKVLEDGGLPAQ